MIDDTHAGRILAEMAGIAREFQVSGRRSTARGMSGTKYAVLQHLRTADTRLTLLAARLGLSTPVTSRAVQDLEAAQLVARTPDPDDARSSRLSITDAGLAYLGEREDRAVAAFAARLDGWSRTDAERALTTLRSLREHLAGTFEELSIAAEHQAVAGSTR